MVAWAGVRVSFALASTAAIRRIRSNPTRLLAFIGFLSVCRKATRVRVEDRWSNQARAGRIPRYGGKTFTAEITTRAEELANTLSLSRQTPLPSRLHGLGTK